MSDEHAMHSCSKHMEKYQATALAGHLAGGRTTRDNTKPMANVPVSVPEMVPRAVVRATTYMPDDCCQVQRASVLSCICTIHSTGRCRLTQAV